MALLLPRRLDGGVLTRLPADPSQRRLPEAVAEGQIGAVLFAPTKRRGLLAGLRHGPAAISEAPQGAPASCCLNVPLG